MGKNREVGKYLTPRLGNADFHSKINTQNGEALQGNFGEEVLISKNGEKLSKWTQNWDTSGPRVNS